MPTTDTEELPGQETLPGTETALTCGKCGNLFDHTGRGRKPKTCPDCRPARGNGTARATGPESDTAPKRPRSIEALERNLHQQLTMVGVAVAVFDTFDAEVIIKSADRGAKALANLAATNPKIRAALESTVEGAGYVPVAMWVGSTILPILAHHGILRGVPDPARSGPTSPGAGPAPMFMPVG